MDINDYMNNKTNDPSNGFVVEENKYSQIKALDNMIQKINDGGSLVFTSCWAGADVGGVDLSEKLQKLSNKRLDIYLNMDKSLRGDIPTNPNIGLSSNLNKGWLKTSLGDKSQQLKNSFGKTGDIQIDTRSVSQKKPIKELETK